jgi:hypothetical protein
VFVLLCLLFKLSEADCEQLKSVLVPELVQGLSRAVLHLTATSVDEEKCKGFLQ